jgi:outer membrane protein TolC
MLKRVIFVLVFLPHTLWAAPFSLDDCYKLTLENSESLKIKDQQLKIAEANYKEALSTLYPQISYEINHTRRDNSNFGRVNKGRVTVDDPSTPIGGSGGILGRTQSAGLLTLTQPVFSGFREYLLSEAAKKDSSVIALQNIRARELLYQDVADLFYQIIYTENDLKVLEQSRKTLSARVGDLQEFIKLGKSRESEVIAANSELADLETSRVQSKGLIQVSKELLAFLTALPSDELFLENKITIEPLESLDHYLSVAHERSDVEAGKTQVEAEELRLKAAHRERWPQVDLSANAYTWDDPDRNRDWDMYLLMTVPIFDWGRIAARTEAEEAKVKSANLGNLEKIRTIERDVRVAYANVAVVKEQIASLNKLRSAAKKNYDLQKEDYSNGVVTNLDVLQAIRQIQDTERRLIDAEEKYQSNLVALKVAAGGFIQ